MFAFIKKKIDSHRDSKNIFWRILVTLKYILWYVRELSIAILLFVIFGWQIRYLKKNSFFFSLGKKFPEHCMLLDCDNEGAIFIPLYNEKYFGWPAQGEYLALKGYFSKFMPTKGCVVVDGGAYYGLCTIIFSLLVGGSGKVISFEPDAANFEKLQRNVKKYKLSNVVLLNKGLSNEIGEREFYSIPDGPLGSSYIIKDPKAIMQKSNVVRLDEQLEQLGIKKVDFIKMDIEGAEMKALIGSEKTLKNGNVNIAIASYHKVDGQQTCFAVEKILREYGYESETGYKTHLTTYGWRK